MYDKRNSGIGLMRLITSIQNDRIKQWHKLKQRKHRERENKFLIEGFHLIEEAYQSHWPIETIICLKDIKVPEWMKTFDIVTVNETVLNHLAETKSPQGILAVVRKHSIPVTLKGHVILLDRIQDPGNLGTIIRTADAAGFSAIYLGKGTVDVYNDKVIRATQGSLFHIPLISCDLSQIIEQLKEKSYTILATDLSEYSQFYHTIKPIEKAALILGNEAQGVKQKYIDAADIRMKIPIYGQAESLNVSIAAGILMYHLQCPSQS